MSATGVYANNPAAAQQAREQRQQRLAAKKQKLADRLAKLQGGAR